MKPYNLKKNKLIIGTVNNPFLYKFIQKKNPTNNIIYRNVINNKNRIYKYYIPTQLEQKKFYDLNDDNNNNKCFNTQNIKVNRILNKNTFEEINLIKMKMGFDLLTKKINMINDTVEMINDSIKNNRHSKQLRKNDSVEPYYFRDRILINRNNKALNNNYMQKEKILNNNNSKVNISSKSYNYFSPDSKRHKSMIKNNFHTHTNYKSKNKINDYFITDNDDDEICGNYYLTDFSSLEPKNMKIIDDKTLKKKKYNSYHNLHRINNYNNITTEYYKYSNSINNIHNVQKSSHNYYGLIKNSIENNSPDLNYYKVSHKNKPHLINQKLTNYFNKDKCNLNDNNINNNNNNNMNKKKGKKNKEIYYGSFDEYFLDNQSSKGKDSNNNNNNNNNNDRINIICKNEGNKNNYNIYNIINKDKIIQNNYYNTDTNNTNTQINYNLKVENRDRCSFYGSHKKNKKDNIDEESDSIQIKESKKKYKESNLQRCSTSDLFLPHKKIIKNENKISNEKLKKYIKSKDDFYYDLFAEKIFEVKKNNNSHDEIFKFSTIKNNFLNKFENKNNIKVNKLKKKSNIKKVRFFENDNHFIQFNQEEKASKFTVFNYLGNKIYFKHCNIDKYYERIKSKNENIKSILINKDVNISDNSEWNNLFEMINKIKSKQIDKDNLKDSKKNKKSGFNIKNIESFRKKNEKNIKNNEINNIKNNKSKQINKKNNNIKVSKENKNKSLYNNVKNKVVNTLNKKGNFIDNKFKNKVK